MGDPGSRVSPCLVCPPVFTGCLHDMYSSFALLSFLLPGVLADTYALSDYYTGTDFLSDWVHENIADPTHGRV